jgi:glycosyltransferase involved in cell wall biosynthesis
LQDRAIFAGSKRVEFLPTVVDFNNYTEVAYYKPNLADMTIKIVWIGTPETEKYLQVISGVLERLSIKYDLELNLIGGKLFSSEYFKVKHLDWSAELENRMLAECHIGVMPLFTGNWELGKCGYKLVQYLASGLPAVGTAIGANKNILQHGENGYLASTTNEWYDALENLILNPVLRKNMGIRGREIAKERFSLKPNAKILANYLKNM